MDSVKIFGLIYLLSVGAMYYLAHRFQKPMIIPGDFYRTRNGRITYFPSGGALVLSIIIYYVIFGVLVKQP